MDERTLRSLLARVRKGEASVDEAVERLVAHAGSVALATRFSCAEVPGRHLEGLILVMPEPGGIAELVGHLLGEQRE